MLICEQLNDFVGYLFNDETLLDNYIPKTDILRWGIFLFSQISYKKTRGNN